MAGGINQGTGFGADDLPESSEINVTPFIDVILVLLIIFMVAAPLSTVDAPVELPISTAKPQPRPDKPVFLTLKADLSILIGEDTVAAGQLASCDRHPDPARPRTAALCQGGPVGRLWRGRHVDERVAGRRLSQDRPGRSRRRRIEDAGWRSGQTRAAGAQP